ncbi:hypothetical protein Anapl_09544 [Anas platyrhynchos]|uniref:Uncharacterized protein n=1 Tax=Anas platyrhynchos TaxID=8839 RepID=R0JBD4_ANAPL|nr:hypothetical protein Anapl_09544 [Anas platyrhynchos]
MPGPHSLIPQAHKYPATQTIQKWNEDCCGKDAASDSNHSTPNPAKQAMGAEIWAMNAPTRKSLGWSDALSMQAGETLPARNTILHRRATSDPLRISGSGAPAARLYASFSIGCVLCRGANPAAAHAAGIFPLPLVPLSPCSRPPARPGGAELRVPPGGSHAKPYRWPHISPPFLLPESPESMVTFDALAVGVFAGGAGKESTQKCISLVKSRKFHISTLTAQDSLCDPTVGFSTVLQPPSHRDRELQGLIPAPGSSC